MPLIQKNITALRNVLIDMIGIDDYLKTHVFPKQKENFYDLSRFNDYATQVSICCPFHSETQPSFRVYQKRTSTSTEVKYRDAYCYGTCRRGGSVINVHQMAVKYFTGKEISYITALESLAELYNIRYEPLYFDTEIQSSVISTTDIGLADILNVLNSGTSISKPLEEVTSHYGKYLTLIERKLSHLHDVDKQMYINYAIDLDYLMSLGLHSDELVFELESLYDGIKLATLQVTNELT